ncbi:MAG: tungstate ABC transporter substrate-binding protein WtpA [Hadesarchaea archaeon]|nr:tungstate ABC transporter substrate-binding protein WtpA [Hadesarchaea archaeon]
MPKIKKLIVTAILIIIIIGIGFSFYGSDSTSNVKVFHAGSLTKPFENLEKIYENKYDIDLQREPSGSVIAVQKVTEQNRAADVVAVSDYSLIPNMMISNYSNWFIQFARNEMVLTYTKESDYASEINDNNWFEILNRVDVRFGFSNPNDDPCGYRSLMTIQLSEMPYDDNSIFENTISSNTNITSSYENGTWIINAPESEEINPSDKVRIVSKEVDLLHLLSEGSIDYAFEYRSVAVQHGYEFIELPPEINLGYVDYENVYGKVELSLVDEKPIKGKPIVYGITITSETQNMEGAIRFVELLISEEGQEVFQELGQPPINPAIASNIEDLPEKIEALVSS